MPRYLPVSSHGKAAVAICGRCGFKVQYNDLHRDRNVPGLMVCEACCDSKDPYKLPARKSEKIALKYPRPDEPLVCPLPEEEQ